MVLEFVMCTDGHSKHLEQLKFYTPVPVAARGLRRRSAGRSPAEIVDSNPTEGMDVCLL